MPVYLQHEEAQRPTHDEQRDVGAADEVRFDYDLHTTARRRPGIKTSYGDANIGVAQEERNDLVHARKVNVIARSGNRHWDDDDQDGYQLAGTGEEAAAAAPSNHVENVAVIALVGFVCWLLLKKDKT